MSPGVYLLRENKDSNLSIVYVFFVDGRSGGWYYTDYPSGKATIPIDDSCSGYKWGFVCTDET